jgi:hypothetical protein
VSPVVARRGKPVPVVAKGHFLFTEKVRAYEVALHRIASWAEGAIVASNFDEPCSAQEAREVLASVGVGAPKEVRVFGLARNAGRKLTHVAEVDSPHGPPVKVLCGRVKASSLDPTQLVTLRVTCPNCAWRLSCRPGSP